jgi:S-adenosyl methyltransferase
MSRRRKNGATMAEELSPGDDASPNDLLARLDTSVAHPARVYDYWLGGCFLYTQTRRPGPR